MVMELDPVFDHVHVLSLDFEAAPVHASLRPRSRGHVELPIQQIGRDRGRLAAFMPRTAPVAHLGAKALDPHQPINAMPAATLAQITKVAGHPKKAKCYSTSREAA